jgi:tetratricopeptide (TPR) repeat protein
MRSRIVRSSFALAGALLFAPAGPASAAAPAAGTPPAKAPAPSTAPAPSPAPQKTLLAVKLQALYDDGDDPGVKQLAEERLKTAPEDSEARIVFSRSLVRLGLKAPTRGLASDYFTKALEQLIAVRTRFPRRTDVRLFICDVFFHARRPDMLLTEADVLLRENPGNTALRADVAFYAEQYMSSNQAKSGAAVYSLLARTDPGSAAWAANEGTALLLSGDLSAGTAALLRAARLDPKNAETAHNLGQAYVYQGDWAAAATWFEQAAKGDPDRGRYILDQAVARALNDPGAATPLFERAMKILGTTEAQRLLVERMQQGMTNTDAPGELYERFARELDTGEYPIYALFALEKTLRREPNRPTAILLRADLQERMRYYARALPDYANVRARLAKLPEADRAAARVPAISGEARCLTGLGRAAEALALLRDNGGEAVFPFEIADALIASGNPVAARDLLEKLSSRGSDRQAADTARQRLRALTEGAP